MQCVVELALKAPLELRVVEIARMQIEIIRMNRNCGVFKLDNDFHRVALGAG